MSSPRPGNRFPIANHQSPASEFWASAIPVVKEAHPGFLFLAEGYWGLEARLQALGFDYTYDKPLYDGLVSRDAAGVQRHLLGMPPGRSPRAPTFWRTTTSRASPPFCRWPEHRAAALLILGLPGMRFLHDGQLAGARRKVPVQLARCAAEPVQADIQSLYEQLLTALPATAVGQGRGKLLAAARCLAGQPHGAELRRCAVATKRSGI